MPRVVLLDVTKGVKSAVAISLGMVPGLVTSRRTSAGSSPLTRTCTGVPWSPCVAALPSRLEITCSRRSGSHVPAVSPLRWISNVCRSWSSAMAVSHSTARSVTRGRIGRLPRRAAPKSSNCAISRVIRPDADWIVATIRCNVWSSRVRRRSTSADEMMAPSGVRRSCPSTPKSISDMRTSCRCSSSCAASNWRWRNSSVNTCTLLRTSATSSGLNRKSTAPAS